MGDSVFVNKRSAVHKGSAGRSTAFPDVNLCPPSPPAGPIPTPLPNVAQAADLQAGARSVLIGGNPMAKRSSFFGRSQGNTVALPTGGGVISHAAVGKAYFVSYSVDVTVEGEEAPRHLDMMTHNHLAPSPPNAAVGTYLATMDPGALPAASAAVKAPDKGRKNQPQAIEVFIDAPGRKTPEGVDAFLLASTDGKLKKSILASQATLKGDLLCVRFADVTPGRVYNLYAIIAGQQVPLFETVAVEGVKEHTPGAEKPAPGAKRKKAAPPAEEKTKTEIEHPHDWYESDPWKPKK
jgi:hypothetical protein